MLNSKAYVSQMLIIIFKASADGANIILCAVFMCQSKLFSLSLSLLFKVQYPMYIKIRVQSLNGTIAL